MPGNEVEDGFYKLFELKEFSSTSQPVAQTADTLRGQVIDKDIASTVAPLNLNLKDLNGQELGAAFSRNFYVNHPVNRNVFPVEQPLFQGMPNQQGLFSESIDFNQNNIISGVSSGFKFQQENDSVGSPTLTTNSERSEITEGSADFCLRRRQQDNFSVQQHHFPRHSPMQQSGYDEMQLLQQQVMLKQLQVLQRQQQQQLQQQNLLRPFSPAQRRANSGQFPPLVDGTPVGDASQGYMNWPQRSASPAQQGSLNRTLFSVGLGSHQLDASLYGTPIANARGNMGQLSPMQVMYQDSSNLAAKTAGQIQKPVMHLSDYSNPFLKDQYNFSPAQDSLPRGAFMSNLGFQGKGMPEASPVHGLNNGLPPGNLLMGNSQQISTPSSASSGRQEPMNWSPVQQKDTKPSQGLVPLDPLEEKILFNMEGSSISDIASGVFGDKYDNVDFSNSFPSIQSGSWSALMQSAVAEASSSDTGVQEEFSSLTYQNIELSADNSMSKFIDSDKQRASWVSDSLPGSAPFTAKSFEVANNPDASSSFPGFQLPSDRQRVGSCQGGDTSESTQTSPKVTGLWVDCSSQQKLPVGGNRQVQSGVHFGDLSTGKVYSTEMLDQVHSQIGNPTTGTDDSLISSVDLSQGGKWESVSGPLGRAGVFPNFIQQKGPATMSASGALSGRNGSQVPMVNPPVASQSNNAIQMSTQSGLPHHDATRQFNVWMDLPSRQHPLDQDPSNVPLNTNSSADLFGSNGLSLQKAHVPSGTYNVPQRVDLPQIRGSSDEHISVSTASNKDFLSVSQGWKPGKLVSQNYPSFNNLQVANSADADASKRGVNSETDPNIQRGIGIFGQKFYEENPSGLKASMGSGMNTMSQLNPFAFGDAKMNFMVEARKNQNVQIPSQNVLSDVCSSGMVALAHCHSQNQSSSSNMLASSMECGHLDLPGPTPIWFKQMGAPKNGEMQPAYDSKDISGCHLSSVKHVDVHPHTEQEHAAQDALSEDRMTQNTGIIISKKRKLMVPPWHEQVTLVSHWHQTISSAGQEWAQVTNRLSEKGEYEIGKIEPIQLLPRSKRRLVQTAQLMQQIFRPAPAFILLSYVSSSYDSLLYFVTRATLGDACSFTHKGQNALPSSSNQVDELFEKSEMDERRDRQSEGDFGRYSEVAGGLTDKAKKLEGDFGRLEKAALMAEIKFEIEDLERFEVISRFARFHNSRHPSLPTMPKPIPQRYVTAVLSTRNLPEGVQCLSL